MTYSDRLTDLAQHPVACWCQECDPDFYLEMETDWLPEVETPF